MRWTGYRLAGTELGGRDFVDVDATALATVSTLGSGTRVIGVYEQRWVQAPVGPLCVYLHGVRDPGNVGTVLRSAQAFGASGVAFGPGCADPYSPKAVRASMGAIFGCRSRAWNRSPSCRASGWRSSRMPASRVSRPAGCRGARRARRE